MASSKIGGFVSALRSSGFRLDSILPTSEKEFLSGNIWLLATSLAMIVCYGFSLPNPGLFLLIAVVHSAMTGGLRAGLASASLASLFAAIYLSSPGRLLHYAEADLVQVLGLAAANFGTVGMIYYVRRHQQTVMRRLAHHVREISRRIDAEKTFQALADEAPVPLWMAGADGMRFYFNREWLRYTGKSLEELAGDGWRRFIHTDDLANCADRYALAIRHRDHYEAEYRLRTAAGEYRWMGDLAVPRMSEDGKLLGYLGSSVDRTERKRVESALHQLSGRLLELQDDERRRIARELHDTTAQNLAAISMHLSVLRGASGQMDAKYRAMIAEGLSLSEQCCQEIRTVSYLLHPPLLDELGLVSALRSYTMGFEQRTGLEVELKIGEIGRLPVDIETTVFRIIQEALTNVHRHSGSPRAEVRVIRDPREIRLTVSDKGKGIPGERLKLLGEGASLGVGVAGMRERASQFGGNLRIASSEQGTTITAIVPYGGER